MWRSARPGIGLFLCALSLCLSAEAAQKNPGKQTTAQKRDEQRENEAVRKAQDHLQEVQKDLKKAEADLRESQQRVRQAMSQRQAAASAVQKTLDRLEGEHADLTGLTAARRGLKSVQAEFDEKAAPVRKMLESQADYRAAQASATRSKAALSSSDEDLEVDRKQLAKDHLAATTKVRELEQAAFRRDAGLAAIMDRLNAAEKLVQTAHDKFEKAVERDSELKAVRKSLDDAKAAEDRAEQVVSKELRALATVRMKVAQATQQLQQKKLQDARDDNRGKNKGKN